MWHRYAAGLKKQFFGDLNPETEAFYAAPISLMGIPAGSTTPNEVTNQAVYNIADNLLHLNTPAFGSKVDGYAERVRRNVEQTRIALPLVAASNSRSD